MNQVDTRARDLLYEYGFTDQELAEHLGIPIHIIRSGRRCVVVPRRQSVVAPREPRRGRVVVLKPSDDRRFA